MNIKTRFLNKTTLKKVNQKLASAGYSRYPGDCTTAHPAGCGSGYVSNLLDYLEPSNDHVSRSKIESIVAQVIGK